MFSGQKSPPMLAMQLMKPTAAAAADRVRNADGSAQKAGKYATVPKPSSVKIAINAASECGKKNHAVRASAATNCGITKCQRRSPVRSELQPNHNIPARPAPKISAQNQLTRKMPQPEKRCSIVGSKNQKAYPPQ